MTVLPLSSVSQGASTNFPLPSSDDQVKPAAVYASRSSAASSESEDEEYWTWLGTHPLQIPNTHFWQKHVPAVLDSIYNTPGHTAACAAIGKKRFSAKS